MFSFLKRLAVFGIFLLAGLELVFRTVVPAAEMPAGFQIADYGIMALDQSHIREGHNSIGRLGRPRFRWRVNNFGFNSAYDYRTPSERDVPCAVVIGNSYVQGLYSDADEHLAGQLQEAMGGAAEVYNLGTSGMPLSQSPRVVAYARDTFAPDLIVVQAGFGSIKGSLRKNGLIPYCQQFVWKDEQLTTVPPSRFSVNKRNRLLRKSALVRYLYYNSNFDLGGQGNVQKAVHAETPLEDRSREWELAVARVLDEISELVPDTKILFVFDANRNALYASGRAPERTEESYLLEAACRSRDMLFVDMTAAFARDYQIHRQKFNFEENYHWNPYGVGIVTREIVSRLESEGMLKLGKLAAQGR